MKPFYASINGGKETGFFCEIDNGPINHALFTSNHFLNEYYIGTGVILEIKYFKGPLHIEKQIIIDEKRRVYSNKELDYACIEILEPDGIQDYLKIDPRIFKNKKDLKNLDIFILKYTNYNDISYSYGKIISSNDNTIIYNASIKEVSSGCPIIRGNKEKYIIGLSVIKKNKNLYLFNLATLFDSILKDINKPNEINCIYVANDNQNDIKLIHDYNLNVNNWIEEAKISYLNAKMINKKIFEKYSELYINEEKVKFDYKYKVTKNKEIKVKFKFKRNLTNLSFMFYDCNSLKYIDFSSFNTINITNMSHLFFRCYSLKSIDLTSFNTNNVTNMSCMLYE